MPLLDDGPSVQSKNRYVLRAKANIAFHHSPTKNSLCPQNSWDVLGLVIGLSASVVALAIIRAMTSLELTVKASQRLHDRMAEA